MPREYKPYIPQTIDELWDKLGSMMLGSPKFEDDSGYFPGMSIESEFFALTEGLTRLKEELGKDRYQMLVELSNLARSHFEADPNDDTGEAAKGRQLLLKIEDIIRA